MALSSHIDAMIERWRGPAMWPDDRQRRLAIIKMVAPIFLDDNRAVTPEMINRFVYETAGLNARDTGRRLNELVVAELEAGDLVAG